MLEEFTKEEQDAAVKLAQEECWREGDLTFLLDENQVEIASHILGSKSKFYVVECARRLGKSFMLCVLAVQQAVKKPRSRILYAAPTAKDALEIVAPLIEQICETAPFSIKFDRQQGKFVFPNGSQVRLFGCDNKAKATRGRGSGAHLVLIDEAGFVPVLDYVLHSIVAPQTLTTRGRVILASTPSDEPDHPFTALAEEAERAGNYVRKTIYDNPRLSKEQIEGYIRDDAQLSGMSVEEFEQSDVFKREFLALRVIDVNLVVIPEWRDQFEAKIRPEFFDAYMSLDFGGIDPHAALFGYWDFEAQELVIEDELLLRDGENTEVLAERVKAKEKALWGEQSWAGTLRAARERENLPEWLRSLALATGNTQPYLRVCDNDIALARDMAQLHGVHLIPTAKDDKKFQINAVRVLFRQGKIKVNPRCKHLGRMLRQTMWLNESQKDFRRRLGEHGDLVDCLIYMVRNLRRGKDPRPLGYGIPTADVWVRPDANKKQGSLLPDWRDKM